jgi:copper homeostasis protein
VTDVRLELSTDTVDGAVAAAALGVDRIELCSAGALGGLSPGAGLLAAVLARVGPTEVHVLVRPRDGSFRYSAGEVDAMVADVWHALGAGAAGVVVGALTERDEPDRAVLAELVAAADGRQVTFHRALDVCRNPVAALDTLAELGVRRVLTSGQAATAEQGAGLLGELVRAAAGRIAVMACGGIRPHNALAVLHATGVRDLHAAPRTHAGADRPGSTVDFGRHARFDRSTAAELVRIVRDAG